MALHIAANHQLLSVSAMATGIGGSCAYHAIITHHSTIAPQYFSFSVALLVSFVSVARYPTFFSPTHSSLTRPHASFPPWRNGQLAQRGPSPLAHSAFLSFFRVRRSPALPEAVRPLPGRLCLGRQARAAPHPAARPRAALPGPRRARGRHARGVPDMHAGLPDAQLHEVLRPARVHRVLLAAAPAARREGPLPLLQVPQD